MPEQPSLPLGVAPPRKKPGRPEDVQQSHLFRFLRLFTPKEPRFRFIHGSMNGLPLFGKVLATACRTGMVAGIWDVGVPYSGVWEGKEYAFLYIELKATRSLSQEQKEFRESGEGRYAFVVCRSWVTAAQTICTYLGVDDPFILEAIK